MGEPVVYYDADGNAVIVNSMSVAHTLVAQGTLFISPPEKPEPVVEEPVEDGPARKVATKGRTQRK